MRAAALAAGALLVAGCAGLGSPSPADTNAMAELHDAAGRSVGTAELTQIGSVVHVVMRVHGLPPGAHAVHIHEVGKCEPPAFPSAGAHYNPTGKEHGALNPGGPHAGDLPNVTVGADGTGRLESTSELVSIPPGPATLFDADGSALVIHAAPDDFRTDPTGNSGARIACGVIVKGTPPR